MRKLILTAATLGLALVAPTTAFGSTQLARGVLRDKEGKPHAGVVTAYAWLKQDGQTESPVLGSANAGADGRYSLRAADQQSFEQLRAQQGGNLDLFLRADMDGQLGDIVTTAPAVTGAAVASAASAGSAPSVDIKAQWTRPLASASQVAIPCLPPLLFKLGQTVSPGVIGELNLAYRDSTSSFAFGDQGRSNIEVLAQPTGAAGFSGNGSVSVENQTETEEYINNRRGPYARQIRTSFLVAKYAASSRCLGIPDKTLVRAEKLIGGIDDSVKLKNTIRVCPKERHAQTLVYPNGGGLKRVKNRAVTWNGGLSAFGLGFNIQTGYDRFTRVRYDFAGSRRPKNHYICGNVRNVSPRESPRIFTGAKPS